MANSHVVKGKRHKENFDERKVYASVYHAALNCHYEDDDAEKMADKVTKRIKKWIQKKPLVESSEIRREVYQAITDHEVAMMYEEHLDIN